MIGINEDIIGKYERGENTPSIKVASKLAVTLELKKHFSIFKTLFIFITL